MLPLSQPRRWNFSQLDAVSINLVVSPMCQKSSLSPILFMQQGKSLTADRIPTKSIQLPYSANCITFSHLMNPTLLNFGNVPANLDGDSIQMSIWTPNHSLFRLLTRPNYHGIIARKLIVTIPSIFGK